MGFVLYIIVLDLDDVFVKVAGDTGVGGGGAYSV